MLPVYAKIVQVGNLAENGSGLIRSWVAFLFLWREASAPRVYKIPKDEVAKQINSLVKNHATCQEAR